MTWLKRLVGPAVALLGLLVAAFYKWRAGRAEQKTKDAKQAQATAERDAAVLDAGLDHAKDQNERAEEIIDVHRAEADRLRREALERVKADGAKALGAVQAGDAGAAGRFLRDVMRAHEDGDGPDPGGDVAADGRAAALGGVPVAGRPHDRGRK